MAYTSNQLITIAASARTSNLSNTINSVTFSNTNLRAEATSVSVNVTGSVNSVFSAQVTRSSDGFFYNFTTQTFLAAATSQSRLKNQPPGSFSLAIPAAASGDVYTVIITAESHYGTKLAIGNGIRYTTTAAQVGNAKITFTASGTGITNTALGDSTGSIIDRFANAGSPTVVMNNLQVTVADSGGQFGYFITEADDTSNNGSWGENALYWQTGNYVANGAGTDATALILDNVDGLYVGMQVALINSVYQSDLRAITAINTTTKTLTLDGNETWSNDHVIIFRAYGSRLIKEAIGIGLGLANPTVNFGKTTTTLRTELTGAATDFDVNGNFGISVGATIRMRGLRKNSSASECVVSGVGTSEAAGTISIANGSVNASDARPIRARTIIYIDGSSNKVFLNGTLSISKYPAAAQTINIDMNKILTIGTGS